MVKCELKWLARIEVSSQYIYMYLKSHQFWVINILYHLYLLTLFIVLRRSSHLEDKRAAADMEDLAGTGRAGSSSSLYERLE